MPALFLFAHLDTWTLGVGQENICNLEEMVEKATNTTCLEGGEVEERVPHAEFRKLANLYGALSRSIHVPQGLRLEPYIHASNIIQ